MLNLDKSNWERVSFGDAIENVVNRVDDPSTAGVDRYVGLEHLDPGVMAVERWGAPDEVSAQKLLFEPGDVIFGRRRAYQKKVARADFRGICSAHALVLRARPNFIEPDFLPVFLSSDYFLDRAISISVGSLSPTVNWRDLKVQQFVLPPLGEQRRIADLLWAMEASQRAQEKLGKEIGKVSSAIFDAATKYATITALSSWVSRIEAGRSPRAAGEPAGDEAFGVLKVSAVGRDVFVPSENKRLLNKSAFRPGDSVRAGDLLVTRANAVVDNVARPCMVDRDYPNLMLSDKTLRLIPADGYPKRVILAALRAPAYRAYVREVVNGTEAKNISQQRILAGPVPDLRSEAIRCLLDKLTAVDTAANAAARQLADLVTLKSAALSDAFRGNT